MTEGADNTMKYLEGSHRPLLARSELWIAVILVVMVVLVGYLPDIIYAAGHQIPQVLVDVVARDINLLLIPIPVFYAAHVFRTRGVVTTGLAIIVLALPYLAISTTYAQPLLRLVVFTMFVMVLGVLYGHALEKRRVAARAFEQVQASEERLRDFLENANDMIESVDGQGRFLFVNRAWTAALGYTAEEAAAMTVDDIVHPDYKEMEKAMFARMSKGEALENVRMAFVAKDGNVVYAEGSVNAYMEDGEFVRSRCIFRDVTEKRRLLGDLRASENRYRDLFEHSSEALYTTRPEGSILDANASMAALFGYERDEMIGVDVTNLYANPTDRDEFRRRIEGEGSVVDYPLDLRTRDGRTLKCRVTALAVRGDDGVVRGYQGIMRPE